MKILTIILALFSTFLLSFNNSKSSPKEEFFRVTASFDRSVICKSEASVACWIPSRLFVFSLENYKMLTRYSISDKQIVYAAYNDERSLFVFSKDAEGYYLSELNIAGGIASDPITLPIPAGDYSLWLSAGNKYLLAEKNRIYLEDSIETFIFDFDKLALVKKFDNTTHINLNGVNISPDEKTIVVLYANAQISLYDIGSLEMTKREIVDSFRSNAKPYFSFDGKLLFIAQVKESNNITSSPYLYFYSFPELEYKERIERKTFYYIQPSSDKDIVYIDNHDTIEAINLNNFNTLFEIDCIGSTFLSDRGDHIVYANYGLKHWSFSEMKEIETISIIGSLRGFSSDSKRILMQSNISADNFFISYDFEKQSPKFENPLYSSNELRIGQTNYSAQKKDSSILIIRDFTKNEVVFEIDAGNFFSYYRVNHDLKYVQFFHLYSSQGKSYLKARIMDLQSSETVFECDSLSTASFSQSQTYLFSSQNSYICGIESGRELPVFVVRTFPEGEEVFSIPSDSVKRYCFSADESCAYLKLANGTVEKREILTGELKMIFNSAGPAITTRQGLTFHEVGDKLIDASSAEKINIWSLETGEQLSLDWYCDVTLNNSYVSPDGRYLGVADREGSVLVWNIENVFTSAPEPIFISKNQVLDIFPNPAGDRVNVSLSEEILGNCEISVFDLLGRLAAKHEFNKIAGKLHTELDISKLQAGVYFIRLAINGNQIAYSKLVVSK